MACDIGPYYSPSGEILAGYDHPLGPGQERPSKDFRRRDYRVLTACPPVRRLPSESAWALPYRKCSRSRSANFSACRAWPSPTAFALAFGGRRSPEPRAEGDLKIILVTFGGGVRYAETFAPEGPAQHSPPAGAAVRRPVFQDLHQFGSPFALQLHFVDRDRQLAARGRFRLRPRGEPHAVRALPQGERRRADGRLGDLHQQELRHDGRGPQPRFRRALRRQRRASQAVAARSRLRRHRPRPGRGRRRPRQRAAPPREHSQRRLRRHRLDDLRGRPAARPSGQGHAHAQPGRVHPRPRSAQFRRRVDLLRRPRGDARVRAAPDAGQFLGHGRRPLGAPTRFICRRSPRPTAFAACCGTKRRRTPPTRAGRSC